MFAYLYFPEINPTIFQIWGPFALRWYSLMYAIGFFFCLIFFLSWIKNKKILLPRDELYDAVFSGFLGLLIGARLGFVLFYGLKQYLSDPLSILRTWEGGMSFSWRFDRPGCRGADLLHSKKAKLF